jgi:hypothetical protein
VGEHFSVLLSHIFVVVVGFKYSWKLESLISFFRTLFERLMVGDILMKFSGVLRYVKLHCLVPVTVLFS